MSKAGSQPSGAALAGLRVLELGQLLAGPFCGTILGWLGAEVVKVEPPEGDALRGWRVVEKGSSLWWRSLARNKRTIVLDLRTDAGRDLARGLASKADVLIENFRPGTLEKWGLGPEVLHAANPRLVIVRISGYGQTGPLAHRPGFASVAEAVAGLRSVVGFPDRPPARANLSLGDSLAGLHGALGALAALYARDRAASPTGGRGQVIDVALTESVLAVLESMLPEADRGVIRERAGSTITGIVPSNLYPCADGRDVVIGANGDTMFARLCEAIGRPELAADPALAHNEGRVREQARLEEAIAAFTRARPADEVVAILDRASVPCGVVKDARDVLADPHYAARGLFERLDTDVGPLVIPELAPKLVATPGRTRWAGRALGADTDAVLRDWLGLDDRAIDEARAASAIR